MWSGHSPPSKRKCVLAFFPKRKLKEKYLSENQEFLKIIHYITEHKKNKTKAIIATRVVRPRLSLSVVFGLVRTCCLGLEPGFKAAGNMMETWDLLDKLLECVCCDVTSFLACGWPDFHRMVSWCHGACCADILVSGQSSVGNWRRSIWDCAKSFHSWVWVATWSLWFLQLCPCCALPWLQLLVMGLSACWSAKIHVRCPLPLMLCWWPGEQLTLRASRDLFGSVQKEIF